MIVGVTTAPIPEDWGNLSGQSQEIPNGVHVPFLKADNMRLDFIINASLHNRSNWELGGESWKHPYAIELKVKRLG